MKIFSILFPVVCVVLVGYFYARRFRPSMDAANSVVLRVCVPALVFDVVASNDFQLIAYKWLALAGLAVVLGSGFIAWPVARLAGFPRRAFVPTMMFNNCGNLGLPLAVLAFGEHALAAALVLFLISNFLHFTLGAWIFGGAVSWKDLLTSPVNLATVLALSCNLGGVSVPQFLALPISMLGQVAIPLMLFSLGVRMLDARLEFWRIGLAGALVRPLSGLIIAALVLPFLPLDDFQAAMLVLFAALPPAVLNFLFAEQYRRRPEQVASMVVIGNALSVAVLSVVLWWLV